MATFEVTDELGFTAMAFDRFNNPIPDLTYAFDVDEQAGNVGSEGEFVAGETPGVYESAVTVKVSQDSVAASASATITIEPGPLDYLIVEPAEATLDVTGDLQLIASAFDQFDNPIADLTYVFEADDRAGEVDDDGMFVSGREVGVCGCRDCGSHSRCHDQDGKRRYDPGAWPS